MDRVMSGTHPAQAPAPQAWGTLPLSSSCSGPRNPCHIPCMPRAANFSTR